MPPLSPAQLRTWLARRVAESELAFTECSVISFSGSVSPERIRNALLTLQEQLPPLRLSLSEDDSPALAEQAGAALPWAEESVEADKDLDRLALRRADHLAASNWKEPNSLLFRAHYLDGPTEGRLVLVLHRLISDGERTGHVLFTRLAEALEGERAPSFAAHDPSSPALDDRIDEAARYVGTMDRVPRQADLPRLTGGARSGFAVGARVTRKLNQGASGKLEAQLALWSTLLARYSSDRSFLFGLELPTSSAQSRALGDAQNLIPLHLDIDPAMDFATLVKRAAARVQRAEEFRDVPIQDILRKRGDSELALPFDILFREIELDSRELNAHGTALRFTHLPPRELPFELVVTIDKRADSVQLHLDYSTDSFEPQWVHSFADCLVELSRSSAEQPQSPISELSVLSAQAREAIVTRSRGAREEFNRSATIHSRFEELVDTQPDAEALHFHGQSLSYLQLDQRANQIARALLKEGVTKEARVAVHLNRGPHLIAAVLGIMKAGAVYVPIDPTYPEARIQLLANDAQLSAALVESQYGARFKDAGIAVLDAHEAGKDESPERLNQAIAPDDLAYIIFTSGSTGRPKGVAVEHRGLVNQSEEQKRLFGVGPESRCLQFASMSFDGSIFEMTLALHSGATLVMGNKEQLLPGPDLADFLSKNGVTIGAFPPSALTAMGLVELPALQVVMVAGEECPAELVNHWGPGRRFFNLYGPTEASVTATAGECLPGSGRPPIGRPLANVDTFLVDEKGDLVPTGARGEIAIAGVGLARGYFQRDDLTQQRFVTLEKLPGSPRAYRTGDLARQRMDGRLDFAGRVDEQVKFRGYRIEVGEIESAVSRHAKIRESAVVLEGTTEDAARNLTDRQLVAYYTGDELEDHELRKFVESSLPPFMVPSRFVRLEALPLTPNQKVDKKSLAMKATTIAPRVVEPPKTETEQLVAGLFADLLRMKTVGRQDDFFERGGHSLLAIRLLTRIDDETGIRLSVKEVFALRTVEKLAEVVAERKNRSTAPSSVRIMPLGEKTMHPLTYAQRQLWFVHQLAPLSAAYNCPSAFRIKGDLDQPRLSRAINTVVRRHAALRTVFVEVDGQPVQKILPELDIGLYPEWIDWLPSEQREQEALRLAKESEAHPFDLERGPLFRVSLFAIDEDDHLLVLTAHHIITDGWSTGILHDEIAAAYRDDSDEQLKKLPVQYTDYCAWQRQMLSKEEVERHLVFWRKELEGCPPLLELPTDHPRPSIQSLDGGRVERTVSVEIADRLKALGRQQGGTTAVSLLAAYAMLLSRYSRKDDILVGLPVAGRTQTVLEPLIGMFVNVLPMRVDLSGSPSFRQLLTRVSATMLRVLEYQELPFEKLVEELKPARDLSYNPLVQYGFVTEDTPLDDLHLEGLETTPITLDRGAAQFDLILFSSETDEGLKIWAEYSTDLYEESTIERLLGHFETLLGEATAQPDLAIGQLEMLPIHERKQVLSEFNDTTTEYPRDLSLDQIFRQVVAEHPDLPAIEYGTEQLSYADFDRRSDQLAAHLANKGVKPGDLVALSAEPGIDVMVGTMAIIKAGAAYVPLDRDYPEARLRFMIEDTRSRVLLTTRDVSDKLPQTDAEHIYLEDQSSYPDARAPKVENSAESTAYVIYTSGSTGRPKGVCVPHRGVVRLVKGSNFHKLGPGSRLAQISNISFDAATFEIWGAFLNGGKLVGIPKCVVLSPHDFADALDEHKISGMFTTVALFNQVASVAPEAFASVETLLVGGEAVDPNWMRSVLESGPPKHLMNGYGPTENTTFSTYWDIKSVPDGAARIPIGVPIANSTCLVLDENHQLVPIGVPGELYVGGDGLASGYLNRPELTAERFIPNPYSSCPQARLYKTGDLVRRLPGGEIDFLGRLDHQVKVRGFRIELGEIEAVLGGHPAVAEVAVIVREDRPGDKRVVAYLVPGSGDLPPSNELAAFMKTQVPDYLIPAAFVTLQELPLTPNLKVDRKALPAPETTGVRSTEPPQSNTEKEIFKLFGNLLGSFEFGITDSFFESGGHSLLATQLLAQIEQKYSVRIDIRDFFATPTVKGVAGIIDDYDDGGDSINIERAARRDRDPLSLVQQDLYRFVERHPSAAYNVTTALEVRGPLNSVALKRSLDQVVKRHEALRVTFTKDGEEPLQIVHPLVRPEVRVVSVMDRPEGSRAASAQQLIDAEAARPFILDEGPMLRALVVQLGESLHHVLLSMPHLVADGWSAGVLLKDMASFYNRVVNLPAANAGRLHSALFAAPVAPSESNPALPPLPLQYGDFVAWQKSDDQDYSTEIEFWKEALAEAPITRLPTDRTDQPSADYHGDQVFREIDLSQLRALKGLGHRHQATLFMVVLAGIAATLNQLAGDQKVVVGIAGSGRRMPGVDALIGCLFNRLALVLNPGEAETVSSLVEQTRDRWLVSLRAQDLPYERVLQETGLSDRSEPLLRVGYAPQEDNWQNVNLRDLKVSPLRANRKMSPLDLVFYSRETKQGLELWLEYRTALFDSTTAEKILNGLIMALTNMPSLENVEKQKLLAKIASVGDLPTPS